MTRGKNIFSLRCLAKVRGSLLLYFLRVTTSWRGLGLPLPVLFRPLNPPLPSLPFLALSRARPPPPPLPGPHLDGARLRSQMQFVEEAELR